MIATESIDVSAWGLLLGILFGVGVFVFLEWVGAPRILAGIAGAIIFLLLAFS